MSPIPKTKGSLNDSLGKTSYRNIEKIVKFVRLSNIETYELLIWKVLTIKWSA